MRHSGSIIHLHGGDLSVGNDERSRAGPMNIGEQRVARSLQECRLPWASNDDGRKSHSSKMRKYGARGNGLKGTMPGQTSCDEGQGSIQEKLQTQLYFSAQDDLQEPGTMNGRMD